MNYKNIIAVTVLVAVVGLFGVLWPTHRQALGSVAVGNSYSATTTPQVATGTNLCPHRDFAAGLASSTTGTLGSVNILASGGGRITIIDATTTNATQRAVAATTSLTLAAFPASATAGSYHFDVEFKNGLLVDYTTTGTGVSSSTISYRCGS